MVSDDGKSKRKEGVNVKQMAKETAKQHYEEQLKTLHDLLWEMDCYHVNELNRSNEEDINWSDCGTIGHIIESMKEIVRFAYGREEE